MNKNRCGDCKNFIKVEGTPYGRCKIRKFLKYKTRGMHHEREFRPLQGRKACKDGFILDYEKVIEVYYCKYCGKEIKREKGKKGARVFCSPECRMKWYGRQSKPPQKRYCLICGKPLTGRRRVYCSDECAEKAKTYPLPAETISSSQKNVLSISEINAIALREHLSYGEVVNKYRL